VQRLYHCCAASLFSLSPPLPPVRCLAFLRRGVSPSSPSFGGGWGEAKKKAAIGRFRSLSRCLAAVFRGPAGSRTPVRTRKPYAFYTLIPAFIFVPWQDLDHQPRPYLLKFHLTSGALQGYFRFSLHRLISGFGTTSSERCLVPLSDSRIKPVIYCTSIRQRERSCFRQLNLCSLRLWS